MTPDSHCNPCRLCGAGTKVLLSHDGVPSAVQTLVDAKSLERDKPVSLTLCRCTRCGLVQLSEDPSPNDLYTDDYLFSVNFSTHARDYQLQLADRWANDLGRGSRSVLEVGGGDGFFAEALSQRGCSVTLIDPAPKACRAARERRLRRVVEGYLTPETFPGERFEAVVARHVLEHVNRPTEFLGMLKNYLVDPGGRLFVEVPNLDGIVANGRYQDFYTEHLSYFEPRTLATALDAAGYEVQDIYTIERGDYLVGVARVPAARLEGMLTDAERSIGMFREFVETSRLKGRRLAIWGAGGRCASLLALVRAQELGIVYVVDSDQKKWGRFLPVSHLPVVSPEALRTDPVDDLIVAATAFQDEILGQLRWFLERGGRIGLVQPEPHWLGEREADAQ